MEQVDQILNFDHLTFWVGNAKQAAAFYCIRMGFKYLAFKGLETGSREIVSHVVTHNKIRLVFQSPYNPGDKELGHYLIKHGDSVRDVAFTVENIDAVVENAKKKGAKIVKDIWEENDEDGTVRMAVIYAFGDITHTLVERGNYKGLFLPSYHKHPFNDALEEKLPPTKLTFLDHVVSNQPQGDMEPKVTWYKNNFEFHRFWSVDDNMITSKYSSLRSVVISNYNKNVLINVAEPAPGLKKSQIQEFLDFNGSAGIQHIAFNTNDINATVKNLRARGCEFLVIPKNYYTSLKERLSRSVTKILEDMNLIEENNILIDFDEKGYLLQIFTKPVQDRPTLFVEIIQRRNFNGFGAGNFRSLFEAIERSQIERGNF